MSNETGFLIFVLALVSYLTLVANKVFILAYLQVKDSPFENYFREFSRNFISVSWLAARYIFRYRKSEWPILEESKANRTLQLIDGFIDSLKPFLIAAIGILAITFWVNSILVTDSLTLTLGELSILLAKLNRYGLGFVKDHFLLLWIVWLIIFSATIGLRLYISWIRETKNKIIFSLTLLSYLSSVTFFAAGTSSLSAGANSELNRLEFSIKTVHDSIFSTVKRIAIDQIRYEIVENIDQKDLEIIDKQLYTVRKEDDDYTKKYKSDIIYYLDNKLFDEYKKYSVKKEEVDFSRPYGPILDKFESKYDYQESTADFYKVHTPSSNFDISIDEGYLANTDKWNYSEGSSITGSLNEVYNNQANNIEKLSAEKKVLFDAIRPDIIEYSISFGTDFIRDALGQYSILVDFIVEPLTAYVSSQISDNVIGKFINKLISNDQQNVDTKMMVSGIDKSINRNTLQQEVDDIKKAIQRSGQTANTLIGQKRSEEELERIENERRIEKQRKEWENDYKTKLSEFNKIWNSNLEPGRKYFNDQQLKDFESVRIEFIDEFENTPLSNRSTKVESRISEIRLKPSNIQFGIDCKEICPICHLPKCFPVCMVPKR